MGRKIFKEWILPVILAISLALLINEFLLFKVEVPTGSMEPTIQVNDQFLVSKILNFENLKRGDILVFYNEELKSTMIKRLIGLPGDKVEIKGDDIYINGEYLKEEYVKYGDSNSLTYEVPEGKYFFLGDNRANSADSREWENPYIDEKDIKGKAQIRIYPLNRFGSIDYNE